ncbi:hypothetical protein [Bdellovibrio sp. HCB274]|uniref:hypothetical protein n=1 Tax=Bdellovibrio sp. HCB274 TaxID=3394361 RepID=UPI0039B3FA11
MKRIIPFVFLWTLHAQAQVGTPLPTSSAKPVSVSYENLIKCFPELKDDSLAFKVDLTKLKEFADEKIVTIRSQLRQRKISYLDADQDAMILTLKTAGPAGKNQKTELTLQKVAADGVLTDMALTKNQRTNPKQEIINNFLLHAKIKSDEYSYHDTKLNGVTATYKRNFKEVTEFNLEGPSRKRSLACASEPQLGIICTCTKK